MRNKNIFIIGSTFYPDLLDNLFQGVKEAVNQSENINLLDNCTFISVPGAFEIPGTVKTIIDNENPDLIITLGVLIKGETAHFEHISSAVSNSISALSIQSKIPIIFGIITAYNKEQAITRSSLDNIKNNKGYQAMQTGIDMLKIYDQYKK
jgi:6,7-dimethyl-8-ribityllumazine synthase